MRKTSFYFSFLALPAAKRRAITAVFDFCRAVDDSVDLETDPARIPRAVAAWRDEVARVFSGQTPGTPQGRALQPFVVPAHLPRAQFDALIDGVAMDAAPREYATFEDLEPYCHRVASAVGLICAEIFEYREPVTLAYARDLGVALQLTNILRDVATDYRNGRRYLPTADLVRFGCTWDDIGREVMAAGGAAAGGGLRAAKGVQSPQVKALLAFQGSRARSFFDRATSQLPPVDARQFVAAEIMRAVYWDILRRIEQADWDVFSRVIRAPRIVQARIAFVTWWNVARRLPEPASET